MTSFTFLDAFFTAGVALAQECPQSIEFEVASVKLAAPQTAAGVFVGVRGGPGTKNATRINYVNESLRNVVGLGNRSEVYADAILNVRKLYAESPLTCVSGVTGSNIRRRIEAIMSNRAIAGLNLAKKTLLACAGLAALSGPVVIGVLIGIGHVRPVLAQLSLPQPAIPRPLLLTQQQTQQQPATPAKPAATVHPLQARPCWLAPPVHKHCGS